MNHVAECCCSKYGFKSKKSNLNQTPFQHPTRIRLVVSSGWVGQQSGSISTGEKKWQKYQMGFLLQIIYLNGSVLKLFIWWAYFFFFLLQCASPRGAFPIKVTRGMTWNAPCVQARLVALLQHARWGPRHVGSRRRPRRVQLARGLPKPLLPRKKQYKVCHY